MGKLHAKRDREDKPEEPSDPKGMQIWLGRNVTVGAFSEPMRDDFTFEELVMIIKEELRNHTHTEEERKEKLKLLKMTRDLLAVKRKRGLANE